jgi:hypothetical protein
MNIDFVKIIV